MLRLPRTGILLRRVLQRMRPGEDGVLNWIGDRERGPGTVAVAGHAKHIEMLTAVGP